MSNGIFLLVLIMSIIHLFGTYFFFSSREETTIYHSCKVVELRTKEILKYYLCCILAIGQDAEIFFVSADFWVVLQSSCIASDKQKTFGLWTSGCQKTVSIAAMNFNYYKSPIWGSNDKMPLLYWLAQYNSRVHINQYWIYQWYAFSHLSSYTEKLF